MDIYMLTTIDNPFSPVTQYDEWLTWDLAHYNTNALLARVAHSSPELSEFDQVLAIQDAIDQIVEHNVSGVHVKVKAGTYVPPYEIDDEEEDDADSQAA